MKVLILSCSTGGGHDSAAKALLEGFEKLDVECELLDPIKLTSKRFSNMVNKSYIDMVTNKPNMFKVVYHMGELYGKLKIKSPVYGVNKIFSKKLNDYIIDNNYDYIVATHLYPAETLTSIKKRNKNIRFIAVATDYVSIPFWEETNPDYFVVPTNKLKKDFISKGIPKNKLLSFGIPVSSKFNIKYNKKDLKKQLSLSLNKKNILIMSGSMGYGNVDVIIDNILSNYDKKVKITVICGNNKILEKNLKKKYKNKVNVNGFVNNVNMYMKASDLLLTKPGGLSSTESAVSNIPTIFTDPIPGCENYNAEYFKNSGMAFVLKDIDKLNEYIYKSLYDKKNIVNMKMNQSKYINKNSTKDICNFVVSQIKKIKK